MGSMLTSHCRPFQLQYFFFSKSQAFPFTCAVWHYRLPPWRILFRFAVSMASTSHKQSNHPPRYRGLSGFWALAVVRLCGCLVGGKIQEGIFSSFKKSSRALSTKSLAICSFPTARECLSIPSPDLTGGGNNDDFTTTLRQPELQINQGFLPLCRGRGKLRRGTSPRGREDGPAVQHYLSLFFSNNRFPSLSFSISILERL